MSQRVVKETLPNLDVTTIYESLMETSTGKHSAYIKAKESLLEYFGAIEGNASIDGVGIGNQLSTREKADMLAKLVSEMAVSITNAAMQTAVSVAKENRDAPYVLTKLRVDTEAAQANVLKIEADTTATNKAVERAEVDKQLAVIQGWKVQSDMVRENGLVLANLPAITETKLPTIAMSDKGSKWEQEQQVKMSVYATLAKAYRESGVITWTVDNTTNKIDVITDLAPNTPGLTKAQENVAIRQEIAFDDNMRQHVANSSANMVSLLTSTDNIDKTTPAFTAWSLAVDYLNEITPAP